MKARGLQIFRGRSILPWAGSVCLLGVLAAQWKGKRGVWFGVADQNVVSEAVGGPSEGNANNVEGQICSGSSWQLG